MLKEFRTIYYDQQRWIRYATWVCLGGTTLLLLWTEGGFPPKVWYVFAHTMQQFPHEWAAGNVPALFSLLGLGLLSLMWLLSWTLVAWVALTLLWPHTRDARHVAWREARSLGIHAHQQLLHEDAFGEDVVNVPKLRLPQRNEGVIKNEGWISNEGVITREGVIRNEGAIRNEGMITREGVIRNEGVINQAPTRHIPGMKHTTPRSLREIRASKELQRVSRNAVQQDLIAVGQTQRGRSTTPLPHLDSTKVAWQRTPRGPMIDEIPTTPERSSHAGAVGTLVRTKTKLEVGVGWNSGLARRQQPNEDSLVVLQGTCTYNDRLVPFGLFVVADGMGGHDFGQEASRIAIQNMMQVILHDIVASDSLNDTIIIDLLVNAVEQANTAICNRCREWGKDMGTTLTAALIVDIKAYVVNVGDSRTYLYDDDNGLSQITRDHSLVANLVMAGTITPDEIYTHPERNKVYRSLGNKEGVEVDWFTRELRRGDTLLLCSDGLWEMVRDPDISLLLSSHQEPTQISEMLVHAALRGGGADNVSVIVVRVG